MMKEKLNEKVKARALKQAQELGEMADTKDISSLDEKLPAMKKGVIAKIWDKVLFLWEQIKSPEVPVRMKIVIVGALLYLVLPIDVLPDSIPGFGLLDDFAVILAVFREVTKYVVPKLEKKLEQKLYEVSYQKIDEKLSSMFALIMINTMFMFLINMLGCGILVSKPFGNPASQFASYGIFVTVFIYGLIRFILYWKEYGRITKSLAYSVCKKKSISKGIADYVKNEYLYIAYIFNGVQIANAVLPELQIPDLHQIIKVLETHYKKRLILFVVIMAAYTLLITGTKFYLMHN